MIAKNLKFLRKHFGDKQEVLAKLLNVPQSNISNYENKKKPIPIEILDKISIRYSVSIDDITNKDLSLEFDTPQPIDLKNAVSVGENMFPLLSSNVAKTNNNFNRAYKYVIESLQIEKLEMFYSKTSVLEHAIELFQKAWKESNTYVALSNSITVILLIYVFYYQNGLNIGQELLTKGKLSPQEIQNALLKDPSKPLPKNPYENKRKAFFEKYEDLLYDNIKKLKSNSRFSDLGDYYLAMCYYFGFADDCVDYNTASTTGICMLIQQEKLDNEYARKFIESIP